jgi:hypothetical protein
MLALIGPDDATDKTVTWAVYGMDDQPTDLAEISAAGLLAAKADGEVKVVATANDGSGVEGSIVIGISGQEEEPVEGRPFTIDPAGGLDRTAGIKAVADVELTPGAETHTGKEVVVFQLMKGNTPVSIVAMEKDITSKERFTAYFNVPDPQNSNLYGQGVCVRQIRQ